MAYSYVSEATNKLRIMPNLPGEFCGNWHPQLGHQQSGSEHPFDPSYWRKGRPRPIGGTTEELIARGWFGLYLLVEVQREPGSKIIPTPAELLEPAE